MISLSFSFPLLLLLLLASVQVIPVSSFVPKPSFPISKSSSSSSSLSYDMNQGDRYTGRIDNYQRKRNRNINDNIWRNRASSNPSSTLYRSSSSSFSSLRGPVSSLTRKFMKPNVAMWLVEGDEELVYFGSGELDSIGSATTTTTTTTTTNKNPKNRADHGIDANTNFYQSLQRRQKELKYGIGKRYVVRVYQNNNNTNNHHHHQKSCSIDVRKEPTEVFGQYNIISQLKDGQIITSTGPSRGLWIPHDGGGWSISRIGSFTCLVPIDD